MSQTTLLSDLYLAGNFIGNKGIQILAEGLKYNDKLMLLDLTNNEISGKIGAEAIIKIITASYNNIKKLVLKRNSLGDIGISKFAIATKNENCQLNYLDLTSCSFT